MPDAVTPVRTTPSLWHPLRNPMFRNLLIADLASDIGTFMQSVGAAWLMVSLGASTAAIALTQTAATLGMVGSDGSGRFSKPSFTGSGSALTPK